MIRWILEGDEEEAEQLKRFAQGEFWKLETIMQTGNLVDHKRVTALAPGALNRMGATITCEKRFSDQIVTIYVPPYVEEVEEEIVEPFVHVPTPTREYLLFSFGAMRDTPRCRLVSGPCGYDAVPPYCNFEKSDTWNMPEYGRHAPRVLILWDHNLTQEERDAGLTPLVWGPGTPKQLKDELGIVVKTDLPNNHHLGGFETSDYISNAANRTRRLFHIYQAGNFIDDCCSREGLICYRTTPPRRRAFTHGCTVFEANPQWARYAGRFYQSFPWPKTSCKANFGGLFREMYLQSFGCYSGSNLISSPGANCYSEAGSKFGYNDNMCFTESEFFPGYYFIGACSGAVGCIMCLRGHRNIVNGVFESECFAGQFNIQQLNDAPSFPSNLKQLRTTHAAHRREGLDWLLTLVTAGGGGQPCHDRQKFCWDNRVDMFFDVYSPYEKLMELHCYGQDSFDTIVYRDGSITYEVPSFGNCKYPTKWHGFRRYTSSNGAEYKMQYFDRDKNKWIGSCVEWYFVQVYKTTSNFSVFSWTGDCVSTWWLQYKKEFKAPLWSGGGQNWDYGQNTPDGVETYLHATIRTEVENIDKAQLVGTGERDEELEQALLDTIWAIYNSPPADLPSNCWLSDWICWWPEGYYHVHPGNYEDYVNPMDAAASLWFLTWGQHLDIQARFITTAPIERFDEDGNILPPGGSLIINEDTPTEPGFFPRIKCL